MHWFAKAVEKLSWRTHRYLSLALLGLFWVFALSGLLLNHSSWQVSSFWPSREVSHLERKLTLPDGVDNKALAANIQAQLGLAGELDNVRQHAGGDSLTFNVVRPGEVIRVDASLREGTATAEINRTSIIGVLSMLHTFTGVRARQPESTRDWPLTKAWSLLIDLLAVGMILIVAGGLVISFRRADNLVLRVSVFLLGLLVCCFFLFGLQWLY